METLIQPFLHPEMWNVWMNLLTVSAGAWFLMVTGPWRHRFPGAEPVPVRQKVLWITGMGLLYFASGSPIRLIGHELFSVHMFQQSLLYLVIPPILLSALPAWLVRPLKQPGKGSRWLFFWTRPFIALLLFNGLFSLYHVPIVFDVIMGNIGLHIASHLLLFFAALAMWWPVMCPVPEWNTLSPLRKMVFICAAGVLLTPACALIIFADQPLYASYTGGPRMFPVLSPMNDQQLGGVVMKIMQEITYAAALGVVFFQWVKRERSKEPYGVPVEEENDGTAPGGGVS